jgi:hypothetical protein
MDVSLYPWTLSLLCIVCPAQVVMTGGSIITGRAEQILHSFADHYTAKAAAWPPFVVNK